MTDTEITEYKKSWLPGTGLIIPASKVDIAKTWCRRNLSRQSWAMTTWYSDNQHLMQFETTEIADQFKQDCSSLMER